MFFLLAADDTGLEPKPENLETIEEALVDLDDDPNMGTFGSGPYWPRIRDRLLGASSSKDPKEAITEWKYIRMWVDRGQCELCGHHPIRFHFQIENRINGNRLILGSECIYNYLQIQGVPNKETLKRRLNQLRAIAKKQAEGTVGEGAVQEMEKLQELEREVNILIGKVSRPERDIDILDYQMSLEAPLSRLVVLGALGQSSKVISEICGSVRSLRMFLQGIQKRSSKYKTTFMLPAVEAIMRMRDVGERQVLLKLFAQHITNTFKLGAAEEAVEMVWAEIRSLKKDATTKYLARVEEAKGAVQKNYSDVLDQLKPYPHLAFTIQAGILSIKKVVDEKATKVVAALDSIDSDGPIDRTVLSPYTIAGPQAWELSLGGVHTTLTKEAHGVILLLARLKSPYYIINALEDRYKVKVRDFAGVSRALLLAADEGECDIDGKFDETLLQNPKVLERLVEEVDEIKNRVADAEGQKVWESMGEQLRFDVQKFYQNIDSSNAWLVSFGRSIFAQWQKGLKGLSYKQRGIVDQTIGKKKAGGSSLWTEMQSELNARHHMKFSYGR